MVIIRGAENPNTGRQQVCRLFRAFSVKPGLKKKRPCVILESGANPAPLILPLHNTG